ncbi:MAG: hypothetical protein DWQ34_21910 [Planctomycetota bacterium]|nr:MAG: hypothetical protein DWQ29_15025 [Planctomycetota bacterium]REJ88482.1 MAG: hypothetical protein DWQ34_21910 [Planctomycetota bacterium]REK22461.1 MAG: hypothetical protein DWQ41_19335 [Planctomycetota bacterium]REK34889.1 MAG: hypothetical protein DWQ45_12330 [Planctomycetota bacterium]
MADRVFGARLVGLGGHRRERREGRLLVVRGSLAEAERHGETLGDEGSRGAARSWLMQAELTGATGSASANQIGHLLKAVSYTQLGRGLAPRNGAQGILE